MMKFCFLLLLSCVSILHANEKEPIITIRNLYEESASKKASNSKLILLLKERRNLSALMKGYMGAALMIEANHLINPLSKWSRFKTGRKLIEEAVDAEPANVEMRYIRLTIQTNLPAFLRYSDDVAKDKHFIINSLSKLRDRDLADRMTAYLLSKGICSAEEIKKIEIWKSK